MGYIGMGRGEGYVLSGVLEDRVYISERLGLE